MEIVKDMMRPSRVAFENAPAKNHVILLPDRNKLATWFILEHAIKRISKEWRGSWNMRIHNKGLWTLYDT